MSGLHCKADLITSVKLIPGKAVKAETILTCLLTVKRFLKMQGLEVKEHALTLGKPGWGYFLGVTFI